MKQVNYCDAEKFFETIHPKDSKGSVVLEGPIKNRRASSFVTTTQLSRLLRHACVQKDILFSPSRFYGSPLLLNFSGANALVSCIPVKNLTHDVNSICSSFESARLPRPTVILRSGCDYYLLWLLDEPLSQAEFYLAFLFQQKIFYFLREKGFSPKQESLEIVSKVPVPGTIESKTKNHVSIAPYCSGSVLRKECLEAVVYGGVNPAEKIRILNHAKILQELLVLFERRAIEIHFRPDLYSDWIWFIGASLKFFCSDGQLRREILALGRAVEGGGFDEKKQFYEGIYQQLVAVNDGHRVAYKNSYFTLETWVNFIFGRLEIEQKEVDELGLYTLANEHFVEGLTIVSTSHTYRFLAEDEALVPVSELFFRNAS